MLTRPACQGYQDVDEVEERERTERYKKKKKYEINEWKNEMKISMKKEGKNKEE